MNGFAPASIKTTQVSTAVPSQQKMLFRARSFEFVFPRPALVMGVLNVTPDSFYDGGKYFEPAAALTHAQAMILAGADIIDVGGESTRPGAAPVSETEELRRVLPVIELLAASVKTPISIDTMKPGVARVAVAAGASLVNDIAAAHSGEAMWRVVKETGAGYVLMHMQGTPQTMQSHPAYQDVTREVRDFLAQQLARLIAFGVPAEQIVLDVGLGFGKTVAHNLELLAGLRSFTSLARPLLLGVSRKSFIGKAAGNEEAGRLAGALACTVWAAEAGVQMFRTHDVAATAQALRMREAIAAAGKQ